MNLVRIIWVKRKWSLKNVFSNILCGRTVKHTESRYLEINKSLGKWQVKIMPSVFHIYNSESVYRSRQEGPCSLAIELIINMKRN